MGAGSGVALISCTFGVDSDRVEIFELSFDGNLAQGPGMGKLWLIVTCFAEKFLRLTLSGTRINVRIILHEHNRGNSCSIEEPSPLN